MTSQFMWHFRLSFLLLSMHFVSILSGQETPEDFVSLDFTVLYWDKGVIRDLQYLSDQKVESIDIFSRGLSTPVHYTGPERLNFFRQTIDSDTGNPIRDVVASVQLPTATSEVLLIFIRDKKAEVEHYNVIAIKRDRATFPKGSYQIYNLSDYPVTGKLGDQTFNLEYHGNNVIDIPQKDRTSIEVKFAQEENGEWELGYSSIWSHYASKRVNIFILNNENSISPIDVRRFSEFLPE